MKRSHGRLCRYQNTSEVLCDGPRLVEERQRKYEASLEAIQAKVLVATNQIDAGAGVRFFDEEQLETYLTDVTQRAKSRVARQHAAG